VSTQRYGTQLKPPLFAIVEGMPKFKFAKLVRDKIIDHQLTTGAITTYRQLDPNEHKNELVNKIIEESQEITQAKPEEIAMEIADVQQALDDLKEKCGFTNEDIAKAQAMKNEKNGAFKKGLYIDYVEVADDSEWAAYYRDNADRYPEIN
jgi:predicted house-cleaning noncanonical NTP pyrophosphatase (MazG superfamily)